ncbi:MAG: paraquat-inducible protein A [Chthoniobacterales bacterium]|nr:paraquat-inducible protein A [Chthoniobacterales bacterium]
MPWLDPEDEPRPMENHKEVWRECPDCGADYLLRPLAPGELLQCRRCDARLATAKGSASLQAAWALVLTGLILLVLANVYPVMKFTVAGNSQSNLVVTGIEGLVRQGYGPLAALVLFSSIVAPALYLLLLCYVLAADCTGGNWPGISAAWRWAELLAPWNLVPVFAVACLVAVVRLDLLGTVTWEHGALFIVLLSACCLVLGRVLDRERIEVLRGEAA